MDADYEVLEQRPLEIQKCLLETHVMQSEALTIV